MLLARERIDLTSIFGGVVADKFIFIEDNITPSGLKYAWLKASADRINAIYDCLIVNNTVAGREFVKEMINQMMQNPITTL